MYFAVRRYLSNLFYSNINLVSHKHKNISLEKATLQIQHICFALQFHICEAKDV